MGVVCAAASFLRCSFFHGTLFDESLSISLSMLFIVLVSAVVGAALPLFLHAYNIDPGHAGAAGQVIMDLLGVSITCIVSLSVVVILEGKDFGANIFSPIVKGHFSKVKNLDSIHGTAPHKVDLVGHHDDVDLHLSYGGNGNSGGNLGVGTMVSDSHAGGGGGYGGR